MPRKLTVPLLAALGWMAAAQAFALTVPLKYTTDDEEDDYFISFTRLEWKSELPAGEWKLPETVGEEPLYAWVRLGEQERLLLLDRMNEDDVFYSRLRFDANGDRDLTNDPKVIGKLEIIDRLESDEKAYPVFLTGPIDTHITVGGKEMPYRFKVSAYCRPLKVWNSRPETREQLLKSHAQRVSCYTARAELDGQRYQFSLADSDGNGIPGDPCTEIGWMNLGGDDMLAMLQGDRIFINQGGSFSRNMSMPLGRWLVLGEKLYEVTVDIPGKKLTLEPVEATAALVVPSTIKRLLLFNVAQSEAVTVYQPTGRVPLPPGSYHMIHYSIAQNDAQGDKWTVVAVGSDKSPRLALGEGSEAEWTFGEPYEPIVLARMNGSDASFGFQLIGRGREQIMDLAHEGGNTRIALDPSGRRPKAPTWQVVRADGERVASGSFEYG